jgi:hypothetical protein
MVSPKEIELRRFDYHTLEMSELGKVVVPGSTETPAMNPEYSNVFDDHFSTAKYIGGTISVIFLLVYTDEDIGTTIIILLVWIGGGSSREFGIPGQSNINGLINS